MRTVTIKYIAYRKKYTIGKLYIDGAYQCDMLCPEYGETSYVRGKNCVPRGIYRLSMEHLSPRFSSKSPYKSIAGGRVPRVKGFYGSPNILIHCGNYPTDTEGCFLVGENKQVGAVLNSRDTYKRVVPLLDSEREWELIIK